MKVEQLSNNNWIIEFDGLIVRGDTLMEAVIEFGLGMQERGRQEQARKDKFKNPSF